MRLDKSWEVRVWHWHVRPILSLGFLLHAADSAHSDISLRPATDVMGLDVNGMVVSAVAPAAVDIEVPSPALVLSNHDTTILQQRSVSLFNS